MSIAKSELFNIMLKSQSRMSLQQRTVWSAINITLSKWQISLEGDAENSFWAVGILGQRVLWYNDVEGGFNNSHYFQYGVIGEYFTAKDTLEDAVQKLIWYTESGGAPLFSGPPRTLDQYD